MASYLDPVTTLSGVEDPFAAKMRRGFLESAFDLAATPTPIAQQQIAGLDPLQQQARQLAGGLGQFQPFIQQAAGFYGPQGARDFYNPYEDAVVQQTISDLTERSGIQGIADRADAVKAGAFGGSRGRLMESERFRALNRGLGEAIGGIRSRGFEGARAAAQGAASGLAGLAQTGQAGLINQIGTLGSLGGLGRGIQQAGFDATFDAARRTALEPRQRLQTLQGMLSLLPRTQASTVFRAAAGTDPTAQALGLLRGGGLGGILGFEEGTGPEGVPQVPEGKKFAGLRALAKERPDVVKKMGYEQGGEVFPEDEAYNFVGGTGPEGVPYPVKMQEGDSSNTTDSTITGFLRKYSITPHLMDVDFFEEPSFAKWVDATRAANKAGSPIPYVAPMLSDSIQALKVGYDSFLKEFQERRTQKQDNEAVAMMQEGGIAPEVFEEGDDEINNALNKMVDMTRGVGGTETPMVEMPEVDIETARVKSPGGSQQEFISLVKEKEGNLQDAIKIFLTEKTEDDSPPAQIQQEIQTFVDKAEGRYKKEVADAALKLNIDINTDQVTLITDEFDKEIESMFPKLASMLDGEAAQKVAMMEKGGEVDNSETIEKQKQIVKELEEAYERQLQRGDRGALGGGTSYIDQAKEKLDQARKRLEQLQQGVSPSDIRAGEKTQKDLQKEADAAAARGDFDDFEATPKKDEGPKDTQDPMVATRTTEDIISPYLQNLQQGARRIGDAALLSATNKQGGLAGTLGVIGKSKLAEEKARSTGDLAAINVLGRGTGSSEQARKELGIASIVQKELEGSNIFPYTDEGLPNPLYNRMFQDLMNFYKNQLGA
tara:strand:- start:1787 stop:4273 length:2487 start_codon:yes stop_codon:yes gene_type:complete